MRTRINKTFLATILVLVLTVTLLVMASPIAEALNVDTTATIIVTPDPIGRGQITKFIGDINPNPPTSSLGFRDISIIITYPDGSNITLGPVISNTDGGVTIDFVPTIVGSYSVNFTFPGETLSDGHYYGPCEAVTDFVVQNEPFTFNPTSPEVGQTVTFDASNSSDLDGTIINYVWNFGDENTGTGVTVSHSYASTGTYTVTLIVTDNDLLTNTTTKSITVSPPAKEAPEASFTYSPPNPDVSETITFDASGSSDPDGMIINYIWDFGDGTTGAGMTVTHSYTLDGTYTVTLTVTDNDALTGTTTKTISNVIPEFPSCIIMPLFMAATFSAVMVYRRLTKKASKS